MVQKAKLFFMVIILMMPVALSGAELSTSVWYQTSSTAGDCAGCTISITTESPHTVVLHANNGWVGYLYYVPEEDAYHGFLELRHQGSPGFPDWRNQVFMVRGVYEGLTFTLMAESPYNQFTATYRERE